MKPITLPDHIYSPDQLSALLADLNDYQTVLRSNLAKTKVRGKTQESDSSLASSALLEILDITGMSKPTPDSLDQLRSQLDTLLINAPIAHITLAELPSTNIKKKITLWFRTKISPNMLVTFSVRSDIGGGAVVQCGSRLYDFSFRNLLLTNKQKLAEIASHV